MHATGPFQAVLGTKDGYNAPISVNLRTAADARCGFRFSSLNMRPVATPLGSSMPGGFATKASTSWKLRSKTSPG